MSKHNWKFTRDIKDPEWEAFVKDAGAYLKGHKSESNIESYNNDSKELMVFAKREQVSDNLVINRTEDGGSCDIQSNAYFIPASGVLAIAQKHFGDKLKLSGEWSIKDWQPAIDDVVNRLKWNQGEMINMMTERLGFKK